MGVSRYDVVALDRVEVTPRLASVRIRWELRRRDGSAIYDFTAIYTLARIDGMWRLVAIAHDEVPKLQAALGAR